MVLLLELFISLLMQIRFGGKLLFHLWCAAICAVRAIERTPSERMDSLHCLTKLSNSLLKGSKTHGCLTEQLGDLCRLWHRLFIAVVQDAGHGQQCCGSHR